MSSEKLSPLASKYVELRSRKRDLEKEIKDINGEMDQIELELVPILEEMDAQNIKLEGIGTIYLQSSYYASAVKGKEEELNRWLEQHGQGAIIKHAPHPSTLKSEYQRWMEEDLPLPPPDLVTAFSKKEVRVRKS